jgi:hypothetical protein
VTRFRPSRALLIVVAVGFAASVLLYAGLWIYAMQKPSLPEVELGVDSDYQPAERVLLVTSIYKNSPAERAGLRAGDRIVAIEAGDQIQLTVQRPGAAAFIFLTGTFRRRLPESSSFDRQLSAWGVIPWVMVGLAVLFLRLRRPPRGCWP